MRRDTAPARLARGTLLSHFRMMGAPVALSGSMPGRPTPGVLVARRRPAPRLEPADPRTLARAVEIAAVTSSADLHQHPATTAIIEPVSRLLQRSHAPPQGTGQ